MTKEEMERFNISQDEKCVSAEEKKDLNCEEAMKILKIQCEYCKTHCGEIFHFELAKLNFNLEKEISELKKICDFNCPVHKLATHNTCLTCPAVRNSPHHDLKNVTDEELQKIIKDAEAEMEM